MLSSNVVSEQGWVGEDSALPMEEPAPFLVTAGPRAGQNAERPTASTFRPQTTQAGGNMRYNPIRMIGAITYIAVLPNESYTP